MAKTTKQPWKYVPNKFGAGHCPGCGSDGPTCEDEHYHERCESCGFDWNKAFDKAGLELSHFVVRGSEATAVYTVGA